VIRPFTCVCLILAAGSGLYLYQVKQRAFALDASLRSTFHDIDEARERTRMLRADWALVNDPERLQALATQYLTLQPMQPSQLLTMDQLAAALPPPAPFGAAPAPAPAKSAPAVASPMDLIQGMPMAEATPRVLPHTNPAEPEAALLQPTAPQSLAAVASAPLPPLPSSPVPMLPQAAAPLPVAPLPAAPLPVAPQPAAAVPHVAAATVPPLKPAHRWAHRSGPQAQPWLAETNGYQPPSRRHGDRHTAPEAPAARQFYAANVPTRGEDPQPRITPPAATVMYSSSSGSSLGMASSAALAPPRPLYSTSQ
jgi:hypothetical protein